MARIAGIRAGRPLADLLGPRGDGQNASADINSEVCNHIRQPGPVFFAPYTQGAALTKALEGATHDVIEAVKRSGVRGRGGEAADREVPVVFAPRRPGDVAACYADPALARAQLGWQAQYGLSRMCEDSWRWQSLNPNGFNAT